MKSYDVVIVGAGPAGLRCAEVLGSSCLKVLVLEKNKVIGPKPCAGLMTTAAVNYFNGDIGAEKFTEVTINVGSRKAVLGLGTRKLYTVDRMVLGRCQLRRASRFSNVEIRRNSEVTGIGDGYVTSGKGKVGFRYLVGADGSSSIVRRHLGIKAKVAMAVHYTLPRGSFRKMEFLMDSRLFNVGYAWIIPHKDYVSIGVGSDPRRMPAKKMVRNFHRWLEKKGIDVSKGVYEAHPLNYDYRGFQFGNIFLAGDAAGLICGFSGEGIHPAMVSGETIAKIIMGSDEDRILGDMLKKKKRQEMVIGLLGRMGPFRPLGQNVILIFAKTRIFRKRFLGIFT
jgi:flavin-dependent dehydrogenase